MDELKITKEKVLAAAAKCSTAKEVLKEMFPEVFLEENKVKFPIFENIRSTNGERLIEKRFHNDRTCVWLGDEFHWRIEEAEDGGYLLIPTRK